MNNPSSLLSLLRWLLTVIGMCGVSKGWYDESKLTIVVSAVISAAPLAWSWACAKITRQKLEALAQEARRLHDIIDGRSVPELPVIQPKNPNEK